MNETSFGSRGRAALWTMACLVGLSGVASGQTQSERPLPQGGRVLSFAPTVAEDGGFGGALRAAGEVGAQAVSLVVDWRHYETAPGVFRPVDDPENLLVLANAFYPSTGMKVALFLRPVATQVRTVPVDLEDRPFGDPEMVGRFRAFLDYAFALIPDLDLTSVAIGSEFDIEFGFDAEAWRAYTRFFRASARHIRTDPTIRARFGRIPVGAEVTFRALVEPPQRDYASELNRTADVVMVSYYPLDSGRVRMPEVVHADFAQLVALYPGKPIHFMQIGYPSGYFSPDFYDLAQRTPVLGSSEGKQRRFVREVFRAWDRHAGQIRLLNFSWLTDISPQEAHAFANDDPAFRLPGDPSHLEFLATLGLRTYPGVGGDKAAFRQLRREAAVRGWDGSAASRPPTPQPPGPPSPPDGGCQLPAGHPHFCRDCGPCGAGQGDCDRDEQCLAGLACRDNVGLQFGFRRGIDVCGEAE